MIARALIAALILACTACHAPQPRRVAFNVADFVAAAAEGTSVIEGQAFLTTRGGDVRYAAGREVYLHPKNPYTEEWCRRSWIRGEPLAPPDPRLADYQRASIADGEGRFRFIDIPAGDYYVACSITWEVLGTAYRLPSGIWYQDSELTGGVAHAEVTVAEGETASVVVTR